MENIWCRTSTITFSKKCGVEEGHYMYIKKLCTQSVDHENISLFYLFFSLYSFLLENKNRSTRLN